MLIATIIGFAGLILYSIYGGTQSVPSVLDTPAAFIPTPANNPAYVEPYVRPSLMSVPLTQLPEPSMPILTPQASGLLSGYLASMSTQPAFIPPPANNPAITEDVPVTGYGAPASNYEPVSISNANRSFRELGTNEIQQ